MAGPARKADTRNGKWNYERRRPEQTLLYRLVAEHYPRFLALLADQGRSLPHYVRREFDDFLKCGILEHGFLRVRCQDCHSEHLVAFSCTRRGFCPSWSRWPDRRGISVTAPVLMRCLEPQHPLSHAVSGRGVSHRLRTTGVCRLPAPRPQALEALIQTISQRLGAYLEREGLLVRDIENTYLPLEPPGHSALNDLLGHSITYRIAVGPQASRKAFTLQTVPAREADSVGSQVANTAGFSLHAGVATKAHQRRKLEQLCRYIARPAVASDRLAPAPQGNVRYTLQTPSSPGWLLWCPSRV